MKIDSSGETPVYTYQFYLYDGLGSVVGVVDGNGSLIDANGNRRIRSYDAYGGSRVKSGTGLPSSGYVGGIGHVEDDECGLIYMRARYYDPELGRWISEDPGQNGANWYCYCNGNPVNYVDPNGEIMAAIASIGLIICVIAALIMLAEYLIECYENGAIGDTPPGRGRLAPGLDGDRRNRGQRRGSEESEPQRILQGPADWIQQLLDAENAAIIALTM